MSKNEPGARELGLRRQREALYAKPKSSVEQLQQKATDAKHRIDAKAERKAKRKKGK